MSLKTKTEESIKILKERSRISNLMVGLSGENGRGAG